MKSPFVHDLGLSSNSKKKDNREIINVFVLVELICRILVLKFDYICK